MALTPRNPNKKNVTGKHATLAVGNRDLDITNFESSLSVEMSTSEYSNRYEGYTGYVSQNTEGSYEWDGVLQRNVDAVIRKDGTPRNHIRIMYSAPGITFHFKEVKLSGLDLTGPSDDKLNSTVDWSSPFFRWTRG